MVNEKSILEANNDNDYAQLQGDLNQSFWFQMTLNSENKHFSPHVGKAKMRFKGGSFFFEKL